MGIKTRILNFEKTKSKALDENETLPNGNASNNSPETYAPLYLKILSPLELELKETMHSKLLDILDLSLIGSIELQEARKQIKTVSQKLIDEESLPLNTLTRHQIIKEIEDDILGLGPLESLLYDPTIDEILVNGSKKVYVERYGKLEFVVFRFHYR